MKALDQAMTVQALADHVSGIVVGSGNALIQAVASLDVATEEALAFCEPAKQNTLGDSKAGVVLVTDAFASQCPHHAIVVPQPRLAFARLLQWLFKTPARCSGISSTAIIAPDAQVDPTAFVGPACIIGAGCQVGADVVIEAGCVLGEGVSIGAGSHIFEHVRLYDGVQVGHHCILHAGAIIGKAGFGFVLDETQRWCEVPQLGTVRLGDHVVIGANCTIDRGALGDTLIGEGVKCDNQVQIGHNTNIGAHTLICGCVGISGSVTIGSHCVLGGKTGVADHVNITDHVMLAGGSGVAQDIEKPGVYGGNPIQPITQWKRSCLHLAKLDEWARRIRALERTCE